MKPTHMNSSDYILALFLVEMLTLLWKKGLWKVNDMQWVSKQFKTLYFYDLSVVYFSDLYLQVCIKSSKESKLHQETTFQMLLTMT